jgi:hypothetical protein
MMYHFSAAQPVRVPSDVQATAQQGAAVVAALRDGFLPERERSTSAFLRERP